ncbi:MAG: ABC transporter permease [Lachnospiraceae bacterium]|nr:ABC transporter permease [Lachnospiraceae bacterium]
MRISDLVKMGLRNLSRRKARTALTVLGVIIGTISIVIMVSIGIGMNNSFDKQFMENGAMTVVRIERYGSILDDDGNWLGSKEQVLDDALVELVKQVEHVNAVAPVLDTSAKLQSGKYETYISLRAIGQEAFAEFGYPEPLSGAYPTAEHNTPVVIPKQILDYSFYNPNSRNYETKAIDPEKEELLFKFDEWRYVRNERKKEFELKLDEIAVLGESDNWEYNSYVYFDMEYFKELYIKYANTLKLEDRKKAMAELNTYSFIMINVDNIKNVTKVQEDIEALGYVTYSEMQYLEPLKQTSDMLQMVLGAIGAMAMLVSAINIANTMVMSIYERTREIGIMKVLGCLVKDVKKLFLFEAAMIGLLGGVVGITLSYVASFAINKYGGPLFATLMQSSGVYDVGDAKFSVIPFWLPFLAAGFAMLIGILAGYFPARRATKISAIEAMKTDS